MKRNWNWPDIHSYLKSSTLDFYLTIFIENANLFYFFLVGGREGWMKTWSWTVWPKNSEKIKFIFENKFKAILISYKYPSTKFYFSCSQKHNFSYFWLYYRINWFGSKFNQFFNMLRTALDASSTEEKLHLLLRTEWKMPVFEIFLQFKTKTINLIALKLDIYYQTYCFH